METADIYKEIINKSMGRISIIAVPLFFALSELIHPITQNTILEEIKSAKDNSLSWIISHVLALIAIIFLPFLVQKLICFIDEKNIKSSIFGIVLSYIGIIGVTGLLAYDFILWDAWRVGSDEIVGKYLEILNTSAFGILFLLSGPVLFLIGFLTLVILMLKSTKIKKWKSILVLSGLLIYGLAGPLVPISNGHILVSVGALIMLLGFTGILFEDIKGSAIKENV
jgi:hypothetical protein